MRAKRIIPCLDVNKGRVVKGHKFKNIQDVADPIDLARQYNESGADELVFYDITASNENRLLFLDIVRKIAAEITIPFTVGGGIRSIRDIEQALHAGADKVSINSAAVKNPDFIQEAAVQFGSQCIVLAIDAKKAGPGNWHIVISGGRDDTGMDAVEWVKEGERLGAGEIVVNAIDTDGDKTGYSLELTKTIKQNVNIPVIASGGAGSNSHVADVLTEANADAALAASVFHYNEIQIPELKNYLDQNGITVRR
ncbi:imidazole glycerol phosphate synthase subunit HisF [Lentibacillus juripiscarius]|uniref:Imidazole glycerol phosphate synthase subunit HisF n=1 Tax=Lentibacillus juripiscarius TaxID=257446 RepID=A0ABW5V2T2_9BACI